jgi:hypothetical protein
LAVPRAEALIQTQSQGALENSTATANGKGTFESELAPGQYTVSIKSSGGAQYIPVKSGDCTPSRTSCEVNLNQNRKIEFWECIVPSPEGAPLPEGTPTPIPGAQTIGNLEAVGCWTAQPDGSFTSTQPVRLDGIDVEPQKGATIMLHPDQIVTSTGKVRVGVGKAFMIPLPHLNINFQASEIQAEDLGTANPTFGTNARIKGVPFSLTSGGPLQTLLPPWQSSLGKTTLNLDLQLPTTIKGTAWNALGGYFENEKETIPSVGATAAITSTNREGLIGATICGKFTGGTFTLFNAKLNSSWIKQATACYDFHEKQWTLTGLFQLPEGAKFANQLNASVGWESGTTWTHFSIQADGINKQLADGVFLQRIGVSAHDEAKKGTLSSIAGTAGFSFGPQLNKQTGGSLIEEFPQVNGAELISLDGEIKIGLTIPGFTSVTGNLILLRGTPLQFMLAGGFLKIYTEPIGGRVDLGGQLHLQVPFVHWGLDGQMAGFWDGERKVLQLTGTSDVTGPFKEAKAHTLIGSNDVVVCFSKEGTYSSGGDWNWNTKKVTAFAPGTCEIGKYTIPAPETATGASASAPRGHALGGRSLAVRSARAAALARTFTLRLPPHQAGSTIAVRGSGAPPLVSLRGPGLSLSSPPGEAGVSERRALLVKEPQTDTTYITLYEPRGGAFKVSQLSGSAPIVSVHAALPAPRASIRARVGAGECRRILTYTASVPAGESVTLYAQNGVARRFLGYARRRGRVAFAPDVSSAGTGQIVALEARGSVPRAVRNVASFRVRAVTRPRVGPLRLKGRRLSWAPVCGALRYTIVIRHARKVLRLLSSSSEITLPRLAGRYVVSVSAATARGSIGPARTKAVSG